MNSIDSWADIVEADNTCIQLEKKILSNANESMETNAINISCTKSYDLATILHTDANTLKELEILNYANYITNGLKKYIKQYSESTQIDFDYKACLEKLYWLEKAETTLNTLPINYHKIKYDFTGIPRSSYKFCEFNYECQFNYKLNASDKSSKFNNKSSKSKKCFSQHWVHNILLADIHALIEYIELVNKSNGTYNPTELLKSITTISFVIKHMQEEMYNIHTYYGSLDCVKY